MSISATPESPDTFPATYDPASSEPDIYWRWRQAGRPPGHAPPPPRVGGAPAPATVGLPPPAVPALFPHAHSPDNPVQDPPLACARMNRGATRRCSATSPWP